MLVHQRIFFQVNDCDSERFSIRGLVPKEQGETTKALSHIQKGCPPKSSSMFLIEMDIFYNIYICMCVQCLVIDHRPSI